MDFAQKPPPIFRSGGGSERAPFYAEGDDPCFGGSSEGLGLFLLFSAGEQAPRIQVETPILGKIHNCNAK